MWSNETRLSSEKEKEHRIAFAIKAASGHIYESSVPIKSRIASEIDALVSGQGGIYFLSGENIIRIRNLVKMNARTRVN